jgi:hypothetical protein
MIDDQSEDAHSPWPACPHGASDDDRQTSEYERYTVPIVLGVYIATTVNVSELVETLPKASANCESVRTGGRGSDDVLVVRIAAR